MKGGEIIEDCADCFVGVPSHDFEIVEDGSAGLHRLPDAVFEDFKGDAEVKAVLHEGFTGGVVAAAVPVGDSGLLRDPFDVTGHDILEGVVCSGGVEVETACLGIHIPLDDGDGLRGDGEGYEAVRLLFVAGLGADVLEDGLIPEVEGYEVDEVYPSQVV